jgi:predicted dinucleotide-binding enzyme
MKIAIIGAGAMGEGLAILWGRAGHEVAIVGRNPSSVAATAARIGWGVRVATLRDAVTEAEVVVLAVPFEAVGEVVDRMPRLDGRVVIDVTNPYRRNAQGELVRMTASQVSAASTIARRLSQARVVKAYSHVPSPALLPGAQRQDGLPLAVFLAGDDRAAKQVVGELVNDSGFAPIDVGGLDRAVDIEAGGALHRRGLLPAPQARELLLAGHPLWPRAA